jgi:hypothetical protein
MATPYFFTRKIIFQSKIWVVVVSFPKKRGGYIYLIYKIFNFFHLFFIFLKIKLCNVKRVWLVFVQGENMTNDIVFGRGGGIKILFFYLHRNRYIYIEIVFSVALCVFV